MKFSSNFIILLGTLFVFNLFGFPIAMESQEYKQNEYKYIMPKDHQDFIEELRQNSTQDSILAKLNGHILIASLNQKNAEAWYLLDSCLRFFTLSDSSKVKIYSDYRHDFAIKMLSQIPNYNNKSIYLKILSQNYDSEYGFQALKKIAGQYLAESKFDSAVAFYESYLAKFPSRQEKIKEIISILNQPMQQLLVRNIGKSINTYLDEWDPNPTPDGKHLFYTASHRESGFGESDIWMSTISDSGWTKAVNLGSSLNGPNEETIDNVSVDGNTIFLSGQFSGSFGRFDIFTAELGKDGWSNLKHLPMPINSEYTDESACISSDGKVMYFTSDRPGGVGPYIPYGSYNYGSINGNMDIYFCLKQNDGTWSQPYNIGSTINTTMAERSVFIHPDGKTLYFSSEGHPGLGGLDVFKSTRLKENSYTEWSKPINLGKEINTVADDWGYKVGLSGDSAFFAAYNRMIGFGGWDMFSVQLPSQLKPEKVFTISGYIKDSKGIPQHAKVIWEDLETGEKLGESSSNPQYGNYFIVLPLGRKYGYYVEKDGYYPSSNNLDLSHLTENAYIGVDIELLNTKDLKSDTNKVRINNIFFDYNSAELKHESIPELERLYAFLQKNPNEKVQIDGHTDDIGSIEFNLNLSQKRANAVADYLIKKGFPKKSILTKGYGKSKPLQLGDSDEIRAKNRRVEFNFTK